MVPPYSVPSTSPRRTVVRRGAITWPDALVFAVIFALGLARLPTPFSGDQALNLTIGRVVYEGGSLYRDLWDLKHAGVFFFFATGGALFGFNEIGIHLFELLWMLALGVVVRVAAGRWLADPTAVHLAPALTVGYYFAIADERYLTQTEALVGLPLLVSLWCAVEAVRARRGTRLWLVGSGLTAGVVVIFKMPYGAIPIAFWLLALRELALQRRVRVRHGAVVIAPWLFSGMVLPILGTLAYLVEKGAATAAFWTYFRHPAEAWVVSTFEPWRLARAVRAFILSFAPLVVLASAGIVDIVMMWRFDLMTAGLFAWLSLGAALIALQVISWWDYHFFLLLVPLGLLATRGLAAAIGVADRWLGFRRAALRAISAAAIVLLFSPQLGSATHVVTRVSTTRPLPFSDEGMAIYHARHYPHYASIRARTAFLRGPGIHPGPIYVIDTPVYYYLAGRRPAVSVMAPWFHPTDRLWHRLITELKQSRPPYIRVSSWALEGIVVSRPSLADDVRALVSFIESAYETLSRDEDGTWYVRPDLGPGR